MTWSTVKWAVTKTAVQRIQDWIFRAAKMTKRRRLEPYAGGLCAVKNGGSNPCRRQEKLGEMLLGQPSYLMAKVFGGQEHDGEAGVRANMPDPMPRKARAIWLRLDCLNPSHQ